MTKYSRQMAPLTPSNPAPGRLSDGRGRALTRKNSEESNEDARKTPYVHTNVVVLVTMKGETSVKTFLASLLDAQTQTNQAFQMLYSLFSLSLFSLSFAAIGPTADLTLTNVDVAPDGFSRSAVTANGIVPGPVITGNKGDEFNINVINSLTDNTMLLSSSIHWHGLFQQNSSWADGGDSLLYLRFSSADQAGTYWYHSHLCDGLRGVMVIYDPADPNLSLYETTVITLADWYHDPAHDLGAIPTLISTLISGLGVYLGYSLSIPSCLPLVRCASDSQCIRRSLTTCMADPNFIFTIDGHNFTVIEVDGINVQPLVVDSIQIYAGQRYSFVLTADQTPGNYWIRTVANGGTAGFDNGINSAILRYSGQDDVDPTTNQTTSVIPLVETDLHPLTATPVPGTLEVGGADVSLNLAITLDPNTVTFEINGVEFIPPTAPVLLQILSGAKTAAELLPSGSVYSLPANAVVDISIPGGTAGAPHPFHLHGHNFWVVRSAGSDSYNWDDPIVRDVVNTGGSTTDNTTIRFVTDNAGPHIDFHLEDADTVGNSTHPSAWDSLCPTYDALTSDQLGGQ
ncbi:multicopper oxidase/laccase [Favolaschia claudopus]|uniref:laccase n=1 Tax=Favolaschia claudopus TaxID=2862362 RepID=A0AAW0CWG8_9AGAR